MNFVFVSILILCSQLVVGQQINGTVYDENGEPVIGAGVVIKNTTSGTATDGDGYFEIEISGSNRMVLIVSALGFENDTTVMDDLRSTQSIEVKITLSQSTALLDEITVTAKTESSEKKEEAYAVDVIETRQLQNRNVDMNQLATQVAGIRVRESGGLGSNFSYSLNGMSGRSVRFFVNGIPMDRYGSGYAINNFPVNLVDRVEIYKGVVPAHFGSDALGGVINLVTRDKLSSYLDASYSVGSFNTHRAALSTRIVTPSESCIDLQGFYNFSNNNYEVWGPGVEVADPETGRAQSIRTKRFHDDYMSYSGKVNFGLINKPWTDKLTLDFLYSKNFNQIQHGATMASVVGEATRSEKSFAPSITYQKKELLIEDLGIQLFSSVSWTTSNTTDTSSRIYNWLGDVIDERPTNSEMGAGRNGKSLLELKNRNIFQQAKLDYSIAPNQHLNANYTLDATNRIGEDPLISNRTASFKEPQSLVKQVSSLAYQLLLPGGKMDNTVWLKNYDFQASTVDERYITDSLGYRPETFPINRHTNNFGYGYAVKYSLNQHNLLKFSIEKSVRIPDADEILGDGLFVRTAPDLQPEESLNLNVSFLGSNIAINENHRIGFEPAFFFRDSRNLILYSVQQNIGVGEFVNIGQVRGIGGSLELQYFYKELFQVKVNGTYQNLRDWNEFIGANRNQTYQDQLPNTPYLMANGDFTYSNQGLFSKEDEFSIFWSLQYVHEFFLNWPSLGSKSSKAVIPTQLVNNLGFSYSFRSGKYNVSVNCNNLFNEQVYDNYLLQKPGRAFSIKFRTNISNYLK